MSLTCKVEPAAQGEALTDEQGEKLEDCIVRFSYPGTSVTFLKIVDGNHGGQPHRRKIDALVRKFVESDSLRGKRKLVSSLRT